MALFNCAINENCCNLLTEDGVFDLFFRPHTGGFDSSRFPTPRDLPSKAKKNANAFGGWAQVELTDAYVEEGCFAGIHNMFLQVEMRIKRYTYISNTT